MINENVAALNKVDWKGLFQGTTMRSNDKGEVVRYLQMMVEQKTGKIVSIEKKPRAPDGVIPLVLEVIHPIGDESKLKVKCLDLELLSKEVKSVVEAALKEINNK